MNEVKANSEWAKANTVANSRGIDESVWNALKTSVFAGAQDDSIIMAVDYCKARNLDVLMKPVHIVPMYVMDKQTNQKGMRDVIMPGVGMYRIQADRTGNYAGADAPHFGEMITREFTDKNNRKVAITFPEFCSMTVYKQMSNGERVGFTAVEYWLENYATQSNSCDAPNAMWTKRPRAQLAKCVEAQCLRRGWPEIGQDVTAEEMEGKSYIKDITPQTGHAALESQGDKKVTKFQAETIRTSLKNAGVEKSRDLKNKYGSADNVPSADYDEVMAMLGNKNETESGGDHE